MKNRLLFFAVAALALAMQGIALKAQINAFPSYFEGFETTNGSWTGSGTNSSWAWGTPASGILTTAGEGTRCWKTSLTGNYNNSETSYLTSPALNFSCFTTNPTISFLKWQQIESNYDYLDLQFSTDGGTNWTVLGTTASGGTNWYTHSSNRWNGAQTSWTSCSHVLTGLAGMSDVRLRFRFTSDGSVTQVGLGIDAIRIEVPGGPTTAPPPTLQSPSNGAANIPLSTSLIWNPLSCAQWYEVQVSTSLTFGTIFFTANNIIGSSVALSGMVAETQYFWRLRSYLSGIPGAWSNANSFSTVPAPPPAPILTAPANAAVNLTPTLVQLQWNPVPNAASYRVQMALDAGFTQILLDKSTTGSSENVGGIVAFGARYFWRVNASNLAGTGPWSATWDFSTVLPTPSLVAPADAETALPTPVTFIWTTLQGVSNYNLQISRDAAFSQIVYDAIVSGSTTNAPALELSSQYFWRIRAVGTGGIMSNYTASRSFSTLLSSPLQRTPYDLELDVETSVTLSWGANPLPVNYEVQIANSTMFAPNDVVFSKTTSSLVIDVTGLQPNQTYYWRLRSTNALLGNSYWSDYYTFTTIASPTAAIAPDNGARAQLFPIELSWQPVGSRMIYEVQVASDQTFKNLVAKQFADNATMLEFSSYQGLKPYSTYWWRVRPLSRTNKEIAWTVARSFTTAIGTAMSISPKHNSIGQSTMTRFSWSAVLGAQTYRLVVSKNADLSAPIVSQDNLASAEYLPTQELDLATTYYWAVYAQSDQDGSSTSSTWTFSTATAKLAAAPKPLAPEYMATVNIGDVEMSWEESLGAETYEVQAASDRDFINIVAQQNGLTDVKWTTAINTPKTGVFWRVRAVNPAGNSDWSMTYYFSTGTEVLSSPELLAPPNRAVKVLPTVVFGWAAVPNAFSYHVQVAADAQFTQTVFQRDKLVGQSTSPIDLEHSKKYYWRVAAQNAQGQSQWTETWEFTTSAPSAVAETNEPGYEFTAMPQPAADYIRIEAGKQWSDNAVVELVSPNGGLLMSTSLRNAADISMQSLASGIYMLRIVQGDIVKTQQVIIVR